VAIPGCVATEGFLSGLLAIATDGYICDLEIDVIVPGGGASKKKRQKQEQDPLMAQALREDDELIAIVMVATRIMQ